MRSSSQTVPDNNTLWKKLGSGIFLGLGMPILNRALQQFIPPDFALAASIIVILSITYPLFVRGTPIPFTRNKRQWSLLPHMAFTLGFAIAAFFIWRLLMWETPQDLPR